LEEQLLTLFGLDSYHMNFPGIHDTLQLACSFNYILCSQTLLYFNWKRL